MNPLKKLQEPLKKFEHTLEQLKDKLEDIPNKILHLSEHFTEDLPVAEFAEHFENIKYDGIDGFIEKSVMTVLNELAEKALGFDINFLGCLVACVMDEIEGRLKREFNELLDELKEIGEDAMEQFRKFAKHVLEAVEEIKRVGYIRIRECIEAFKNAVLSVPKFIMEEKENIEEVIRLIPKVEGPKSLNRLVESVDKITESVEAELRKLLEPVKALTNLLADFAKIMVKLIAEEVKELGLLLADALRKINTFVQGAGDRVQTMMNPPGWTSLFLSVNRQQLREVRECFGKIQNAMDLEGVCNGIENSMEFLTGKEGLVDKINHIIDGMRDGILHCDDMIDDFAKINDVVDVIQKEMQLIQKAAEAAEKAMKESLHVAGDLAEDIGKEAVKDVKEVLHGVEKVGGALKGLFGGGKKKKKFGFF